MFKLLVTIFLLIPLSIFASDHKPLPAEQAFVFSSQLETNKTVILQWQIAPGYYLYQDQLKVKAPASTVKIGKINWPKAKSKTDKISGNYLVYDGKLKVQVPVEKSAKGLLNLEVNYQGCSEFGYCYPPENKKIQINLNQSNQKVMVTSLMAAPPSSLQTQNEIGNFFDGESNFIIIVSFIGLGLLLAFTPCVLPMIPILSGIILGHKNITIAKSFFLSLAYVLGMAITYAVMGMVVALMGSHIQTFFQSAWAILLGSTLFIALGLSLFGVYELRLPSSLQNRLTKISNQQKAGTYIGVFLMGVLSSLMVSPCVSAPLVGVLAYIAETGDIILGGATLLALGFGMGIPLLLIGVSAGKLLPKAGAWMVGIERLFGFLLFAVAILLLSRIIPGPFALFLWAVLLICTAVFMGVFIQAKNNWYNLLRGLGFVLLVYGIVLIVGAAMGNSNPWQPWEKVGFAIKKEPLFVTVKNMAQLDEAFAQAQHDQKPVLLDFYADWCSACVSLDRYVFSDRDVQHTLSGFVMLRADVTKNQAFEQDLLNRFKVIAPPTVLLFNAEGQEVKRIVGEVDKNEFLNRVQGLKLVPLYRDQYVRNKSDVSDA